MRTEKLYRRLYVGLWVLSGVSLAGGIVAGYPLVGVGAFVVAFVAATGVFLAYDGPLFDERDRRLQESASRRTLTIMGLSAAVVFPAVTAAWALNIIAWPLWLTPIAFFIAALAFVHVGSLMYETTTA
jgi:uncharacterized membrane protein